MSLTTALPLTRRRHTTRAALLGIGTATPPTRCCRRRFCASPWISVGPNQSTRRGSRAFFEAAAFVSAAWSSRMLKIRCKVFAHFIHPVRAITMPVRPRACGWNVTRSTPLLAGRPFARLFYKQILNRMRSRTFSPPPAPASLRPGSMRALIERFGLSRQFGDCTSDSWDAMRRSICSLRRDVVRADPRAKVLVCCVELCSLHMAYGWNPGKLIANALFADGAAAAIIGATDRDNTCAWNLCDTASALLPDTQDAMTWRIGDHGFEMTLSPGLPNLIRQQLGPWCEKWLAKKNLEDDGYCQLGDSSRWAENSGCCCGELWDYPMRRSAPSCAKFWPTMGTCPRRRFFLFCKRCGPAVRGDRVGPGADGRRNAVECGLIRMSSKPRMYMRGSIEHKYIGYEKILINSSVPTDTR